MKSTTVRAKSMSCGVTSWEEVWLPLDDEEEEAEGDGAEAPDGAA